MEENRQYMVASRFRAIEINEEICSGCNRCVDICPMDVLAPNQEKGKPPVVTYPEECWFCGCCIDTCPVKDKGAVRVIIPLPMRVAAVRGQRP